MNHPSPNLFSLCFAVCATLLFNPCAHAAEPKSAADFFNGKDLTGWTGRRDVWSVKDGQIVGKTEKGLGTNEFLKYSKTIANFRLTFEVKLTPDTANSGVQFRSVAVPDSTEMRGYQADIGKTYWGKLYHESGRGMLWKKEPPEGAVKPGEWNTYEIVAVDHHILTAINGQPCVDMEDPEGETEGLIAVQVHRGGPVEVRFRNLQLELNPKLELKTKGPPKPAP